MFSTSVTQLNSIREVDAQEWDSILGSRDFTHSHGFAAALEEADLHDCEYRYLVMRNAQNEIVAHANICLIPTQLDLFLSRHSLTARVLRKIRQWRPGFLVSRVIECGNPVALGSPVVFRNDLGEAERETMMLAIDRAMKAWSRSAKADLLIVRDYAPGEEKGVSWTSLQRAGFVSAPNLENTILDIRWASFDEYLKSLRSHYRYKIRQQKQKAIRAGVRHERLVDFANHASRLAELWKATADQATAQLREELSAQFFASISKRLGDKVFVSLYWLGEKIVAFTLYFDNGDILVPLYVGVDYDHNEELSLVFNAYYDWIETAIELNYRRLDLGITTYEPKLRLGAELEPLNVLMKHQYSWMTRPIVAIYRWFTPQQKPTVRNVFREINPGAA